MLAEYNRAILKDDRGGTPEECKRCEERYCWGGERSGAAPTVDYEPAFKASTSAGVRGGVGRWGVVVVGLVGVMAVW